jgi:hypothetical protein
MRYYEWASKPEHRKGRMVSEEDLRRIITNMKDPGYSSVYSFSSEAALKIIEQGSSKGLGQYPVASNRLVIDIDSDDPHYSEGIMRDYSSFLRSDGLAHTVWFSGSKGYHIEIPHEWIESIDLPYSHLKAVESFNFEVFDRSLYQHGRLLSLPGRIHPKTGKRKVKIEEYGGDLLTVTLQQKEETRFDFSTISSSLGTVLNDLSFMCNLQPKEGNRHTILWGMAKDCATVGLPMHITEYILQEINKLWKNPKQPEDVKRAIMQGYSSLD